MKLLCRWFGHKWKQRGKYSNCDYPRYVCERCPATAVEFTIPNQKIEHPLMTINIVGTKTKIPTEEFK